MRRFLLIVFALCILAPTGQAATGKMQTTKPIYAWRTEAENDKKTGQFNHCMVQDMYDNGTLVMLAQNNDGVQRLALQFPQNKMTAGQHFDLTLQVDRKDLFPVEAIAVSPQILTIGIPQALPDEMRKGHALAIRGPNDAVVYLLDGADGAVLALRDCITTNKFKKPNPEVAQDDTSAITVPPTAPAASDNAMNKVAEASVKTPVAEPTTKPPEVKTIVASTAQPVAISTPAQDSAATASSSAPIIAPVAVAEAKPAGNKLLEDLKQLGEKIAPQKKIATDSLLLPDRLEAIFEAAGLKPTTLLLQHDPQSDRPLDYAWLKDKMFVGVKEAKPVPDAGLTPAATYYLKLMKQRCTGPFVAEATPPTDVTAKKLHWLMAETACSSDHKTDTISALLFANDTEQLTIYFIEVPSTDGAQAIKARDNILKAVLK